jgi:hypothetical protein
MKTVISTSPINRAQGLREGEAGTSATMRFSFPLSSHVGAEGPTLAPIVFGTLIFSTLAPMAH